MSIGSYSYHCRDLNGVKYALLYDKAVHLRDFRNRISKEVCVNIDSFSKFAKMDKNEWITYFRETIEECNSQDIQHAIRDVHTCYENKIDRYNKNLSIKIQNKIVITKYKKDTKNHRKGDIQDFKVTLKSTNLTKCVSYLVKFWSPDLIEFLRNSTHSDPKLQEFRNMVLFYYDKYPERITKLVHSIRNRVIRALVEHPIEFNSLTFNSCNELRVPLLKRNRNHRSVMGAIVTIGAQNTSDGKLFIPVKHNKKYHGKITNYHTKPNGKSQQTTEYTVMCVGKKHIRIVLTRQVRDLELTETTNYLGVDVNVKHNLFCDSAGNTVDFDRELFDDYVKWLKTMDQKQGRKKEANQSTKLSIRDTRARQRCTTRNQDMLKRKAHDLVESAIKNGHDHIIMEDIGNFAKSFTKNEEFDGFKYSRLVKLLNLADLKNIVTSIANKRGVNVSFVQPEYTSKACQCGNISDNNRKTQEEFICSSCGVCMNADHHAAVMIQDRVADDVLKALLLTKDGTRFMPKKISRQKIKSIIHDHYVDKTTDVN